MNNDMPLSYIELSKKNVIHNIAQFRKLIKKGTKISAVIKANAYDHGDREMAEILNPYVDYFQVNSVEELERVRSVTKKQILLLGYVARADIARAIKLGCILAAFDLPHLLAINQAAQKLNKKQKVHIAIDAYLGREGLLLEHVEKFVIEAKKLKHVKIDGVYAHFANIEDTKDFSHAQKQIACYEQALDIFKQYGYGNIHTHISATSGILAYEKGSGFHDIVRVGIGLYGMWPSTDLERKWSGKLFLKPVMRWITHVAQVKRLPKGHSIGYGLTYVTKKPTMIAVIPQGYSNGLDRKLSNKGSVLIRGIRAPILGRVAMNMFVVDISKIKGIQTEDEVVILGTQNKAQMSAEELAKTVGTIHYEITTRISPLLPRIVR